MSVDRFERMILDDAFTKGRFTGRVAVVTGGASGIGKAVVERFANDGAEVHALDINEEAGRRLEAELRAEGHDVSFHNVDVSCKAKCEEATGKIAENHGGEIHMLFNGAAVVMSSGLDVTEFEWEKSMSVNVVGYSNMVQSCFPYMKNDKGCSVVNVCSASAFRGLPSLWTYTSTKGAVWALTRCMALDLSSKGIRVNSISPSVTWTPLVARMTDGSRELADETFGPANLFGRIGDAADVAAAAAFLCSQDARFITGVDLPVDGGYLVMSATGKGHGDLIKKTDDRLSSKD